MDGFCYDANAYERLDRPGWEVRVWANPGGRVRVARFPVDNEDDADELAGGIRLFVRNGGDLLAMMRGGEEPS